MSAHRVITDLIGLEGCKNGTILLDAADDIMDVEEGVWYCGTNEYYGAEILLPARVLIESWER